MFYSVLFKTEKGLFCKNPDGKVYFPASNGNTTEIPKYNMEDFEAGDVVKCDIVHDKEKYGFVVMEKTQTEYPEIYGATIFYNGKNFVYYSINGSLCATIHGKEYILYPYNNDGTQIRDYGYTSDPVKIGIATGKCKALSWDDDDSRKAIIRSLSELTDTKEVHINGPYVVYILERKWYGRFEKHGVRFDDEIRFIPTKADEQIKDLSSWENITENICNECMNKHITDKRLWKTSVLPKEFEFKGYHQYEPDMDPEYPEYVEWKEWADKARKIVTAKNVGTYAPLISEKRVFGFPSTY